VFTKRFTLIIAAVLLLLAIGGWWWHHASTQPDNRTNAVLFSQPQPQGPLLKAYLQQVDAALASDQPILPIPHLQAAQEQAQQAAIADKTMQAAAHDKTSGQALRSQVFQVYKLPSAQATGKAQDCATRLSCYMVEIYFFASNSTGKVVVGSGGGLDNAVLSADVLPHSQPELPQQLTDITKEMIGSNRELVNTLHGSIDVSKLTMVNGKTALKATRCDRSEHLCVAPTLAKASDAYWIIVDLTDARIVGVTWTTWRGTVPTVPPSEQYVIDTAITQKYCGVTNAYQSGNWKFSYSLTGSDGIEVKNISYKGTELMRSVKNPDWHVSYSRTAGFGYSDAVGCPVFSTAAVVPATEPTFADLKDDNGTKVGFELVQEFKSKLWPQPCNYFYQQRFQFYSDGSFRPVVVNLGRGCGDDGTYRPVTRIQPAPGFTAIAGWNGQKWQPIQKEQWEKDNPDAPLAENDSQQRYQLTSAAGTLSMSLGRGQFNDGGHGDKAWVYLDRFHEDKDEGVTDMPTFGACCNVDYRQGPDVYTDGESLSNSPLLLWYVSEQKNNGNPGEEYCWASATIVNGIYKTTSYPCPSGPKFSFTPRK